MNQWKACEKATGLTHEMFSGQRDARTGCGSNIRVAWMYWTEMPPSAVITCLLCAAGRRL